MCRHRDGEVLFLHIKNVMTSILQVNYREYGTGFNIVIPLAS